MNKITRTIYGFLMSFGILLMLQLYPIANSKLGILFFCLLAVENVVLTELIIHKKLNGSVRRVNG